MILNIIGDRGSLIWVNREWGMNYKYGLNLEEDVIKGVVCDLKC